MVSLVIDRPLGSRHPRFDMTYPINYGFLPGTRSSDGDELDAYVLGIDEPRSTFRGLCIAVISRDDDDDPKLIVVSDGKQQSDDEIRSATHFQEQYFQSRIMRGPC